ncbi:uncharacterized protein LOC114276564 [Camellia sinensis]|uniref:uncharacterized protein LOC114276564 n=1 Tax=Camellia sinensis TaxID=4442 RepID=UPI0010369B62|nr:uncharacterized protein LOC114276564 [Camellia sinensis]
MAPFETLYGMPCRSPACWMEVGDVSLLGPELVRETTEKVNIIRECIKTAQSHQKSYADRKRKGVELNVGDFVFLKVSPMKGIIWFGKKGKLAPRFVGPYEIIEMIISPEVLESNDDLTYVVQPVTILNRDVKQLRRKKVNLVKVQWSADENDITWEL